ncbi:fungal-specific transcription factor domain-containing protein [Apiospora kogelbergensis]|uniref:fungal-specific transcription factor domain-containing protein n=1 Tax=Apiospora kogelbergensis TaxID=1337665 RepID=UPI0031323D42
MGQLRPEDQVMIQRPPWISGTPGRRGTGHIDSIRRASYKKRRVTGACHDCRRLKIKCDGGRPKCANCDIKLRRCGYDLNKREAAANRLAILQNFVHGLRCSSQEQAEQLLQRWRDSDGQLDSVSEPPIGPVYIENSPEDPTRCQVLVELPPSGLTKHYVDAFFSSSDELFHVFSKTQILRCCDIIYRQFNNNNNNKNPEHDADTCCVMAVAAVGAQHGHAIVDTGPQSFQSFYTLAHQLLEAGLRECDP